MEDLETCSWCASEVPDSTLREADDGARICRDCQREREHEVCQRGTAGCSVRHNNRDTDCATW